MSVPQRAIAGYFGRITFGSSDWGDGGDDRKAPKSICWVPKQPHSPYTLGSCPGWSRFGNVITWFFCSVHCPYHSVSSPTVTCAREALLTHSLLAHYPPLPLPFLQLRKFHLVCPVHGLLVLPSLTHCSLDHCSSAGPLTSSFLRSPFSMGFHSFHHLGPWYF